MNHLAFRDSHPLDVALYDEGYHALLYISDDPAGHPLQVEIQNTAARAIQFHPGQGEGASAAHHHLALHFRPNTLSRTTLEALANPPANGSTVTPAAEWQMALDPSTPDGAVLYLLYSGSNSQLAPQEKRLINLRNIAAAPASGARGTNVKISFRQMTYANDAVPLSGSHLRHLSILNHQGRPDMPLHVGFVGPNQVLNDGAVHKTILHLRLTNISPHDTISLDPANNPRFLLTVETGGLEKEWALATGEEARAIYVTVLRPEGWVEVPDVAHDQAPAPEWVIDRRLLPVTQLGPGEHIEIRLTKIATRHPAGYANLHLRYDHIPGYWDGHVAVAIEKSRLLFLNNRMGIQTADPQADLHVKGSTRMEGPLTTDRQFRILTDYAWGDQNRTLLALEPNYKADPLRSRVFLYAPNHYYTNTPAITLAGNYGAGGSVGIGTAEPEAQLHVKGDSKLDGQLHATGAARVDGQLRANDTLFLKPTGKVMIDYAWKDENRTLIALEPNYQNDSLRSRVFLYAPNHYYTNTPLITLAGNYGAGGSVGIGATQPGRLLQVGNNTEEGSTGIIRLGHHHGGTFREWDFGIGDAGLFQHNDNFGFRDRSGSTILTLQATGQGGAVIASGALRATSKQFAIAHPEKPDHQLVHACLEGPENAVYYRGVARLQQGEATIHLPGYFEALTHQVGRTVQLTAKGPTPFLLSYGEIEDGQFRVCGDAAEGEFSWEVKAIRRDVEALAVEIPVT